jgi:RNA polymerase sigma factor (TIGR02999 family)
MAAEQPHDVTALLHLAGGGDPEARNALFRLVESELRRRAHARLKRERPGHDLQTTVLIDEAFLKLVGTADLRWEDRSQFYCCAAQVMRQLLVDYARKRDAEFRGGGIAPAPLDQVTPPVDRKTLDPLTLLALDEALTKLTAEHPDLMQVVELHHFGGWELKDIAEKVLHRPYGVVKRQWRLAKALLHREISGGSDDP